MSLSDSQSTLFRSDDYESPAERQHRKLRQRYFAKKSAKFILTQVLHATDVTVQIHRTPSALSLAPNDGRTLLYCAAIIDDRPRIFKNFNPQSVFPTIHFTRSYFKNFSGLYEEVRKTVSFSSGVQTGARAVGNRGSPGSCNVTINLQQFLSDFATINVNSSH